MIEANHLVFKRLAGGTRIWVSRDGESVLGEMVLGPPAALIPPEVSKSVQAGKCDIAVFEADNKKPPSPSSRLWLAGKFAGPWTEVLDAGGKTIGGWQGEWMRVFSHPAGRVISKDSFRWSWINPAGFALASWELVAQDAWRIDFHGLESNQAFCRLLALLKAGEITTGVQFGWK